MTSEIPNDYSFIIYPIVLLLLYCKFLFTDFNPRQVYPRNVGF